MIKTYNELYKFVEESDNFGKDVLDILFELEKGGPLPCAGESTPMRHGKAVTNAYKLGGNIHGSHQGTRKPADEG